MKTRKTRKTKPNETKAGSGRLLCHPVRNGSGLFYNCRIHQGPHAARGNEVMKQWSLLQSKQNGYVRINTFVKYMNVSHVISTTL